MAPSALTDTNGNSERHMWQLLYVVPQVTWEHGRAEETVNRNWVIHITILNSAQLGNNQKLLPADRWLFSDGFSQGPKKQDVDHTSGYTHTQLLTLAVSSGKEKAS